MIRLSITKNLIKKRGRISDSNLQPLDLILAGVASALAVYALNVSVAAEENGIFFTIIDLIGVVASFLVLQFFGNTKLITFDTTAYPIIAIFLALLSFNLSGVLPNDIFVEQLIVPGVLCWMIALGSFFVWRDHTMLFQAVPGVALFGLVGCYDTYPNAIFLFFGFVICQALLLGRANSRMMLRQASIIEGRDLSLSGMRRGPWKWMAGPEWALASGFVVVLISLLGAPLLRESASSFSGIIQYAPPLQPRNQASVITDPSLSVRIGAGPRNLDGNPVLRATLPTFTYLRSSVQNFYDGGRWYQYDTVAANADDQASKDNRKAVTLSSSHGEVETKNVGIRFNRDRRELNFTIEPLGRYRGTIPAPGETIWIAESQRFASEGSGFTYSGGRRPIPPLQGTALIFGSRTGFSSAVPAKSSGIDYWTSRTGIDPLVKQFALEATKGAKSDLQKAMMLQRAIANQSTYDLEAEAVPPSEDPVKYFLVDSKRGYCDLFASSMVLTARAVGLPARYVTGYLPYEEDKDDSGRYIVRNRYAHAWAEILFDGAGWVVFDATEGAANAGDAVGSNPKPFWERPWFYVPVALLLVTIGGIGIYRTYGQIKLYFAAEAVAARKLARSSRAKTLRASREVARFDALLSHRVKRRRLPSESFAHYVATNEQALASAKEDVQSALIVLSRTLYGSENWSEESLAELRIANVALAKALRRSRR